MATVPTLAGANFKAMYTEQEQTMWCWAACARMVLDRLDVRPVPKQCEIACKRLGSTCCERPAQCNHPCPMDEVEGLYAMLGVTCRGVDQPLQESSLLEELFAERPVQIGYKYASMPVGHVVVAIAEVNHPKRGGMKYVLVADPAAGSNSMRLYDDVATDGGKGTWAWTWLDMTRATTR